MLQALAKFMYFKIMKWKLVGAFPKVNKCIIIGVPHTSWVDFFLGILIRKVWNEEINFIGKKSLFKPPLGWYLKWVGGTPVDRSKNSDTVLAIVDIFKERKIFRLALFPEGTRRKVSEWRTGFYYMAKSAEVPIVMVAFDFGHKQIKISEPYYTTNDMEKDLKSYKNFFKNVKGKKPNQSFIAD